jgi:hypothetical protein
MFSSQVFQEGQMHFQFITHWTREHAELEDFQPHRRIFGVSQLGWENKQIRNFNFFNIYINRLLVLWIVKSGRKRI